jgi:hypothetical protein
MVIVVWLDFFDRLQASSLLEFTYRSLQQKAAKNQKEIIYQAIMWNNNQAQQDFNQAAQYNQQAQHSHRLRYSPLFSIVLNTSIYFI